MREEIEIRQPRSDEYAFIRDSWAAEGACGRTPKNLAKWAWRQCYGVWIEYLLAKHEVRVAAVPGVDTVLGWVVWEPPSQRSPLMVYYVFVRTRARRHGIGSMLFAGAVAGSDDRGWACADRSKAGARLITAVESKIDGAGQDV